MEEVFLPGIVLDEPEPFVNSQRANFACHLWPPGPVDATDRLVPSSFILGTPGRQTACSPGRDFLVKIFSSSSGCRARSTIGRARTPALRRYSRSWSSEKPASFSVVLARATIRTPGRFSPRPRSTSSSPCLRCQSPEYAAATAGGSAPWNGHHGFTETLGLVGVLHKASERR
jgi:hypothetical protein